MSIAEQRAVLVELEAEVMMINKTDQGAQPVHSEGIPSHSFV